MRFAKDTVRLLYWKKKIGSTYYRLEGSGKASRKLVPGSELGEVFQTAGSAGARALWWESAR